MAERLHILAVPLPLTGHMTPLVQLCKLLIALARCRATIACNERDVPSLRRLLPNDPEEHHIKVLPISDGLPLQDFRGICSWDDIRGAMRAYHTGLWQSFELHIQSFCDVVCVISDVYLDWTQDVANQLGVPRLAIWSASAAEYQKPLLEFQKAKLKFEAELQKAAQTEGNDGGGRLTYSVVRPTAFFKSLGGQVQTVKNGQPYIMFGDGALCACKPISKSDLASFISDCVTDPEKMNKILPVQALTPRQQGEILFRILSKEPKFLQAPIQIMDFAIRVFDFLVKVFPSLEDPAEFGKIGRYYAAESMLVYDPETGKYDADATPSYGTDTLEAW